jgi:hypothetical protein
MDYQKKIEKYKNKYNLIKYQNGGAYPELPRYVLTVLCHGAYYNDSHNEIQYEVLYNNIVQIPGEFFIKIPQNVTLVFHGSKTGYCYLNRNYDEITLCKTGGNGIDMFYEVNSEEYDMKDDSDSDSDSENESDRVITPTVFTSGMIFPLIIMEWKKRIVESAFPTSLVNCTTQQYIIPRDYDGKTNIGDFIYNFIPNKIGNANYVIHLACCIGNIPPPVYDYWMKANRM